MTAKLSTKEQILEAARQLFSEYGYDGTSIRQIADKCNVNVAAVNYHFGNKHGLFWSIVVSADEWLTQNVAKCAENCQDFENLVVCIFRVMNEGQDYVRSTMKALLTEGVPLPDEGHAYYEKFKAERLGPPGGETMAQFLNKEFGDQVSPEALEWGVQSIFSSMFHWSTMCSTSAFAEIKKKKGMTDEKIEDNLRRLTKSVTAYMRDKSNWN